MFHVWAVDVCLSRPRGDTVAVSLRLTISFTRQSLSPIQSSVNSYCLTDKCTLSLCLFRDLKVRGERKEKLDPQELPDPLVPKDPLEMTVPRETLWVCHIQDSENLQRLTQPQIYSFKGNAPTASAAPPARQSHPPTYSRAKKPFYCRRLYFMPAW